jgi:tetratricopeptide (TPR) repeat protein
LASVPSAPHRSLSRFADVLRRAGWRVFHHPWRLLGVAVLVGIIALGGSVAAWHAQAFYHFRSGRAALARHHNRDALTHFQACLRTWPNDPDVLILAARACWRLKDFTQAGQYLREHQRVAGDSDDYTRESFLVMAAEGDIDKAEKYCQERIDRQDPATPVILEALVSGCMRQYRLAQALAFLQHWLELQPDDTQALLFQITMDHIGHRLDDAIARYRRILQVDPEHQTAQLRLAGTLIETRRYEEALPYLEAVRQREPANGEALVLLAQCQDALGQPDAAEGILDQVLARNPHEPAALAGRGRLALRRGQLEAAEAWLRHALVHTPGNFQARYQLGQCLLQQGKVDETKQQQQKLKQLEVDQKRLRQIMMQEMSQKPHEAALHQEVAMILLRRGDTEGALHWLHSALREDPTSVPLHRALAEFNQDIGNQERAAYHRQFVPPEPDDGDKPRRSPISPPRPGS